MRKQTLASEGSIYYAAIALAWVGTCVYAQSEEQAGVADTATAPETELAPITVSAHEGRAVPYNATGVSVSVLDVGELKREGIYTLSEALTQVPGAYVLPGGGTFQRGNISNLVIRGMSAQRYVLSMTDGMRLDGMNSGSLVTSGLLSRAPIFGTGNIELLRGAEGAVYGGGAMSGVLFLETPEGKGDPTTEIFNEYGSFDSYTGNITTQGRVGNTAFFLSSSIEHTRNDLKLADGSEPTLKHAGRMLNENQALRIDKYINDKHRITLVYRREDSSYRNYSPAGGSGAWAWPASVSLYTVRSNLLVAKYQGKISDAWTTELMVGYYDNDKTIGARGTSDSPWMYELDNVQTEWRNLYRWNEKNESTAGLAWMRTDFDTINNGQEDRTSGNLDSILSVFAEHTVSPVKGWSNTLAARLDYSQAFDELVTLRVGTNYKFNRERTRLYATVGRGYAAPSAFQRSSALYDAGYAEYRGNPDVKCETNLSADLGIEQEIAKDHFVSATLFWARTEDAIGTEPDADWVNVYRNLDGHQTYQGVEFALRGTFEHHRNTGYKIACTLTQPKTSTDEQVANSARQVWSADLHTDPIENLTTGIGLTAACGRRGYGSPNIALDNFYILRWYATYKVNERMSVHVRAENLTDQKYIPDAGAFDTAGSILINPGTAVYGGCTVKF